jgi:acetate kinase
LTPVRRLNHDGPGVAHKNAAPQRESRMHTHVAPALEPSCILTINGGSSSLKFALFERAGRDRLLSGRVERIGSAEARMSANGPGGVKTERCPLDLPDAAAAGALVLDWLEGTVGLNSIAAVGHRVVHGGNRYCQPEPVDADLLAELHRLAPYDPDHLPGEIALIEALCRHCPGLIQVACFDTAFHHDLPRVAQILPIPRRYVAAGVRRYGFHGLSYAYLMEELQRVAGVEAARGRVILAHLGAGASMAAVRGGRPADTTMSFTPTAGLVMATRSGDLDPGLVRFLAEREGMTPQQFNHLVNHESGLLGVSETSADIRDLLEREEADGRAAEAIDLFCYAVKKTIGAYAAVLGGLDTLVFAGGIGENAKDVRRRICAGLEFLGIALDSARNEVSAPLISSDAAAVDVRVIRTDEESMIARSVAHHLDARRDRGTVEPTGTPPP